mgnify:CR=1 FL=1
MIINKISIIVPAYNEEATISIVIDKLLNLTFINNIKKEIIIRYFLKKKYINITNLKNTYKKN